MAAPRARVTWRGRVPEVSDSLPDGHAYEARNREGLVSNLRRAQVNRIRVRKETTSKSGLGLRRP